MERKLLDMMNQLSISEYNPRMKYCDKFKFVFLFVLKMGNSDWNCPLFVLIMRFFLACMNEFMDIGQAKLYE